MVGERVLMLQQGYDRGVRDGQQDRHVEVSRQSAHLRRVDAGLLERIGPHDPGPHAARDPAEGPAPSGGDMHLISGRDQGTRCGQGGPFVTIGNEDSHARCTDTERTMPCRRRTAARPVVAGAQHSSETARPGDLAPVLQIAVRVTTMRVAFVGAGKMARLHLHALRRVRSPHVVAAVCDTWDSAAREFAAQASAVAYPALADLLREVTPALVHVCTPAGAHFEPARQALLAGAHVYVEKPFVETESEARELLAIAGERGLRVCAGHQQVCDPAFVGLIGRLPELGPIAQIDSHFAFRPVGINPERAGPRALGGQLLDILPHPLYTLIAALEAVTPDPSTIEVVAVTTGPADLHAVIRANETYGRLSVSLRARPVASTLSVSGAGGTLTADFIRTSVVGAANPGTGPLEKAANPLLEGWQTAARGAGGVLRRVVQGRDYPGLAELIGEFYDAVAGGGASPLAPDHLRRVTAIYEELAANVRGAVERAAVQSDAPREPSPGAPLAVVTGARGFFGKEITRELVRRGFRIRGISRSPDVEDPHVHEWRALDLSRVVPADAFAGASVVVHAAVDTSGGYDGHQQNTIGATRNVLRAMQEAVVARLVYVSSLSVLRPPRTPWEVQDEGTPLAPPDARRYGSYAWGKAEAERLVARGPGARRASAVRPLAPGVRAAGAVVRGVRREAGGRRRRVERRTVRRRAPSGESH